MEGEFRLRRGTRGQRQRRIVWETSGTRRATKTRSCPLRERCKKQLEKFNLTAVKRNVQTIFETFGNKRTPPTPPPHTAFSYT